ncbi:hypothetical protein DSECCO2_597450 [anaerobic digester metagenome]
MRPNTARIARTWRCPRSLGRSSISAKMPPSPRLSAAVMNSTYLMVMTIVRDQKMSESTPSTLSGVTAMACMPWKHSLMA